MKFLMNFHAVSTIFSDVLNNICYIFIYFDQFYNIFNKFSSGCNSFFVVLNNFSGNFVFVWILPYFHQFWRIYDILNEFSNYCDSFLGILNKFHDNLYKFYHIFINFDTRYDILNEFLNDFNCFFDVFFQKLIDFYNIFSNFISSLIISTTF